MPLWITEREVVALLDLPAAIDALEVGFRDQAANKAQTMGKTHLVWDGHSTLHAIGAVSESAQLVATKTWAHTAGGAMPLLILWNAQSGNLEAIIEAFALGQLRTGGTSGVATRYMARPEADTLALIGAGKQALAQVAAIVAVRRLRNIRIFSRTTANSEALATKLRALLPDMQATTCSSVQKAVEGAGIVTLVTRAQEPFLSATMVDSGTHINAIGAITPERQELCPDILERAQWVVADDVPAAQRLSSELSGWLASDSNQIQPLHGVVAGPVKRGTACDLSVFKAMGMGLSDLALGAEVLQRARQQGLGKSMATPERVAPQFLAQVSGDRT